MSGFVKKNEQNVHKPFPGCMGSMVNIFDLSAGMAGTKLLTQIPHSDGSTTVRNHSELLKKPSDVLSHTVDKQKSLSNKRASGTPVKKLISQEMKKEAKKRQKSPPVVARLMGLDSLPMQQSIPNDMQNVEVGYPYNGSTMAVRTCQCQEDAGINNQVAFFPRKKEYKDMQEIWQKPSRTNQNKDNSTQDEIYDGNAYQKRMTLVRQKFIEAKHLAKDEKLLKSREFQDAIEILSSNKDIFLKFLEEPNSLFSKHHFEHRSVSPPSQTKRITVLKPANTTEVRGEKEREKKLHEVSDTILSKASQHHRSSSFPGTKLHELQELSQPTRIVVLKPSPGKLNDIEASVAPSVVSPKPNDGQGPYGRLHTKGAINSRELAKEITSRMRESLSGQIRNGDFLSSFLSNLYTGDDSTSNKTESECIEEELDSRSDSDIGSPTSQHSWDFLNRNVSPQSISYFSRTSHSPGSSMVVEAKKQLSERLALVATTVNGKHQKIERKRSITLGEMLAIPETKKEESYNDSSIGMADEASHPDLCADSRLLTPGFMKDECNLENSPRSLARSKSVPVSSFGYEVIESHVGTSACLINEPIFQNDVPKSKDVKSSFTGKFSGLFFSKGKKQERKDTATSSSQNCHVMLQSGNGITRCKVDEESNHINDSYTEESEFVNPDKKASSSTSTYYGAVQETPFLEKLSTCENQDEPSPSSVLEAPFKDDIRSCSRLSSGNIITGHPKALSRSPPIESVARSLSRVGPFLETSPNTVKTSGVLSKVDEEQEQCMIVEKLISSAGYSSSNFSSIFTKWYSLEIPLNPMLLDECIYSKDEEVSCWERRLNSKLMFDSTNVALLDISLKVMLAAYPWSHRAGGGASNGILSDASLTEEVWGIIRSWSLGENLMPGECSNINVEMMVKKELTGRKWCESMWLEKYEFNKEISWKLLEELVEEALSEFINVQ